MLIRKKLPLILLALAILPAPALAKKAKSISATTELRNWGLENNVSNSHIQARAAWARSKGSSDITVAVIDTGIDSEHESLQAALWRKKNSQDYGFDFVKNTPNPKDNNGHGTHIAGIIAAQPGKEGVSGVAPGVKIMALRYYDKGISGDQQIANTVKAIDFAIANGARIINFSANGATPSESERAAIARAAAKDIVFVAAAGNESANTDLASSHSYPANYSLENIVSVSAHSISRKICSFANFGRQSILLSAPGEQIYSTLPNNRYGYLSGTSQATAFVSGAVALMLSVNPKLKAAQIKQILRETAAPGANLADFQAKVVSGGMLDAMKAISKAADLPQLRALAGETAKKIIL